MPEHATGSRAAPCPVCGSTEDWTLESWFDEEGVPARVCRRCGNGWIGYEDEGEYPEVDVDPWMATIAEARERFKQTGEYPDR